MEKISWKQVRHNERHGAIPNLRWGHSCCVVDDEVVYFGGYAGIKIVIQTPITWMTFGLSTPSPWNGLKSKHWEMYLLNDQTAQWTTIKIINASLYLEVEESTNEDLTPLIFLIGRLRNGWRYIQSPMNLPLGKELIIQLNFTILT